MNIYQKLNEIQKELRGVAKDSTNAHFRYKYAGHEAINEAIRPLFIHHGINQSVSASEFQVHPNGTVSCMVYVRWTCIEDPTSFVEGSVPAVMPGGSKGDCTPQQCGSLLSYGTKNFAFKALQLCDSNEKDADSYVPEKRDTAPPKPAASPEAQATADAAIGAFEIVDTRELFDAHVKHWRANWAKISAVPGVKDRFSVAMAAAKARLA